MEDGLSVILPAFNEEGNIESSIRDVSFFLRKYIKVFEIIVVDDGSKDSTLEIVNKLKMFYPELKIISDKKNKGYGHALKTGINHSQKKWIFIIDSDGQFLIDDFETFWNNRQKYDFILGYRRYRQDNLYRIFLAKFGNFIANLFLKERIKDVNCGFKLFRRKDLKARQLKSQGGIISFEILYNLFKEKRKFSQIAVNHCKRKKGKQFGGSLSVIFKIIGEGMNIISNG